MTHIINGFLSASVESNASVQLDTILRLLPPGWTTKFASDITAMYVKLSPLISRVAIADGVLYLDDSSISPNHSLVKYITRSFAQESARTCMVCGAPGRRRKEQLGKPPLCRPHYLEFINSVED